MAENKELVSVANDVEMLKGVVENSDMNQTTKKQVTDRLQEIANNARSIKLEGEQGQSNLSQEPNKVQGAGETGKAGGPGANTVAGTGK